MEISSEKECTHKLEENTRDDPKHHEAITIEEDSTSETALTEWIHVIHSVLNQSDKDILLGGNGSMINVAQMLIHKQFPSITGLCSTICISRQNEASWIWLSANIVC